MVVYTLVKEAAEGQKVKYKVALINTVAAVPTRGYVVVLADAIARKGKGVEGGREADSKMLGAYDRDVFNKKPGKLMLGFGEDNMLPLLNTFFAPPKGRVLQLPKRQQWEAISTSRLQYISRPSSRTAH